MCPNKIFAWENIWLIWNIKVLPKMIWSNEIVVAEADGAKGAKEINCAMTVDADDMSTLAILHAESLIANAEFVKQVTTRRICTVECKSVIVVIVFGYQLKFPLLYATSDNAVQEIVARYTYNVSRNPIQFQHL